MSNEIQEENGEQYPYVVRGATIYCTCGSHTRKLDMPVSHGSFIRDKAMMNQADCKVGIDKNIPPFGACSSDKKDGKDIVINEDKNLVLQVDKDNNPIQPKLPIEGKLCEPMFATQWQGVQEDTIVDGQPALNVNCSITCCYGGTIQFMDSGQEVY